LGRDRAQLRLNQDIQAWSMSAAMTQLVTDALVMAI
jgi:hypothetical protein